MVDQPDKISPLDAVAMPGQFGAGEPQVELSERLCDCLLQVQAWPDTVAKVQGVLADATSANETFVMPSGPGRWLIDTDDEKLPARLSRKLKADVGVITDLTHARVVVSIIGEKANWVLASGIAIDFDRAAFPVGEVRLTHHHEIGLTIHRTGEQSFDLYIFTSLARSFWSWISKASAEVGYSVG